MLTCGGECVLQVSEQYRKSLIRRGKTLAYFFKALLKSSCYPPNQMEKPHRKSLIRRGKTLAIFPNPFLKPTASIKTTSKIIDQKGKLPPSFSNPFLGSSLESNFKSSLESSLKSSPKSSLKSGLKTNLKASLRLILEGFWYDFLVNDGSIFGVLNGSWGAQEAPMSHPRRLEWLFGAPQETQRGP